MNVPEKMYNDLYSQHFELKKQIKQFQKDCEPLVGRVLLRYDLDDNDVLEIKVGTLRTFAKNLFARFTEYLHENK